jgi:hypothetical protein
LSTKEKGLFTLLTHKMVLVLPFENWTNISGFRMGMVLGCTVPAKMDLSTSVQVSFVDGDFISDYSQHQKTGLSGCIGFDCMLDIQYPDHSKTSRRVQFSNG